MSIMSVSRKHLSARGLLKTVHDQFDKIKPPRELFQRTKKNITQTDCLMSGVAMFGLKFSSLLKFDQAKETNKIKHNLHHLYHVNHVPSDTYMRERLDDADPREVRKIFKTVFSQAQRGNGLQEFEYLDKHYLLAGDGTGFFTSNTTHCKNCCVKHHDKCQLKFPHWMNTLDHKKNTYLLVKPPKEPWQLYTINKDKEKVKIEIPLINGLQEILADKMKKELSKDEKEQAEKLITAY